MEKVLIVDDHEGVREALTVLFEIEGIPALAVDSPAAALRVIRSQPIGVVVQDMNFSRNATSGEEGVALFKSIRAHDPHLPVLLMTAWTSLETAVRLVKEGAQDYLAKPWNDAQMVRCIRDLLDVRGRLSSGRTVAAEDKDVVHASRAMSDVLHLAHQVAVSDVPVLISGPNGVGKEKIADVIQRHSNRGRQPYVKVNAGAIPAELLESELFGAEAGAFTGAQKRRIGHFETAHRGTLFLDEIGNLSSSGQMKLLRVLQSGEFQRLGSSQTIEVDTRIISATNEDLRQLVQDGRFRQDLYFRLNVIELYIPPLRDRVEDIEPLARYFLGKYQSGKAVDFSADALEALNHHPWDGNVRELENCIRRATVLAKGSLINESDLFLSGTIVLSEEDRQQQAHIERALRQAGGQVAQAARELGVSRQALYRKMDKYGISVERTVRDDS
ncbi:MAG: sigma-54-dependent Fis family transcriptional regulator [Acidobacteria bacterium]|nr:sigma-54-dependent Fis family transcriptional regulator [Acidobacteriota bacterium]